MDALELPAGDEIRDFVAERLKGLSESYSITKVGHITKFIEPVSCSMGITEVLELFAAQDGVESLPIEGDRGIIGIIQKSDLIKKKTALMSVTDPPVERFLDRSTFSVDASENCEKAMALILKREPSRLYDDFMIFESGRFFGIGGFANLTKNIAAIRMQDLDKAMAMQEFLMDRNSVSRPGVVARKYVRMANRIGGDFIQLMDLRDSLSMLACFDVCGKGTAAALLTGTLSSFFSTLKVSGALGSSSPSAIVAALNAVVMDQTPEEVFVAGAFAFVDGAAREATFFNCGFPPIYLFYADPESGKPKGKIVNPDLMPLGINAFVEPRGNRFPIQPNMRLFMHSDGLTEARDERGEAYGDERLRSFLYPRCMKKVEDIIRELDEEIRGFAGQAPQADDITVLSAEIS
jgi:hypothetical protein